MNQNYRLNQFDPSIVCGCGVQFCLGDWSIWFDDGFVALTLFQNRTIEYIDSQNCADNAGLRTLPTTVVEKYKNVVSRIFTIYRLLTSFDEQKTNTSSNISKTVHYFTLDIFNINDALLLLLISSIARLIDNFDIYLIPIHEILKSRVRGFRIFKICQRATVKLTNWNIDVKLFRINIPSILSIRDVGNLHKNPPFDLEITANYSPSIYRGIDMKSPSEA